MQWTPPLWSFRSHRLKVALVIMFALYVTVSMRSTLSMGIVCMVNSTAFAKQEFVDLPSEEEVEEAAKHGIIDGCPAHIDANTTSAVGYKGELLWSPARQSMMFTANYYGMMATMLISGTLADKLGPKRIMMTAISVLIVLTALAPTLANLSYWAYFVSRVLVGAAEGFIVPCANSLGGRWFPPNEKSTMAALYTSGNQIASGSTGIVGAYLCKIPLLGGWPLIFYIFASIACLWMAFFYFVASDHPSDNRWIRSEEREYLEGRVAKKSSRHSRIPWESMIKSKELLACLLCNFTFSFCVSLTQNFLPTYFKEELFLPLTQNGYYTAIPFFTQLVFKNLLASLADHVKKTGKMSPTKTVKCIQAFGSYGTAIVLICLALFPSCHRPWIAGIFLFCYGITFSGGISGFFTSLISIAPAHTGTLSSISMGFGQVASITCTNLVGIITHLEWPHKWAIVFCLGATLQIFAGTFFLFFGTGEQLEWGKVHEIPAKMSDIDEVFLNDLPEPFSDDDDIDIDNNERKDTFDSNESRKRSIDRIRKISREAALVRWTLSSGNEDTILEEEEEGDENIYLNGIKVN